MDANDLKTAIASAIKDAIPGESADSQRNLATALAPILTELKAVKTAQDDAAAKTQKDAAEVKAKEAADALVAETRIEERQRADVLRQAEPLMDEAKFAAVKDGSVKDILVAALTDALPNAATMDEDFLRGALAVKSAQTRRRRPAAPDRRATSASRARRRRPTSARPPTTSTSRA